MQRYRFTKLVNLGVFGFLLFSLGLPGSPAHAIRNVTSATPLDNGTLAPPDRDPLPPENTVDCFVDPRGSVSITPQTINLGESATLTWNVTVPVGCGAMKVYINGLPVSPSGSRVVQPISNDGYQLRAQFGTAKHDFGTTTITVILPQKIIISDKSELFLLLQALGTPGAHISVENQVEMDLSVFEYIKIADGVILEGGRTPRQPGPRFYTTTYPRALFLIESDNVRIAGVRIEGAYQGIWDKKYDPCCSGILIQSSVNVDIQNNEIFGWGHAAVEIRDDGTRINSVNIDTIRVRDNYIHHNQCYGGNGYGVAVYTGAYALIERNVFDWNRHAISGADGSNRSGYLAYRNLVLENGGKNRELPWPIGWVHTHQFDMHGQEHCGVASIFSDALYNCGTAGEYMDIRYNSFFYTNGNAFKLRGTPMIDADVVDNVFAHAALFTTPQPAGTGVILGALDQTESGLHQENNLVGVNGMTELGSCDFDGDGLNDLFLATGQTWWYSSGGDTPWVYLNTSKKRRAEVTLGQFDGDNHCDVLADGVIYPGGKTPKPSVKLSPVGGVISTAR